MACSHLRGLWPRRHATRQLEDHVAEMASYHVAVIGEQNIAGLDVHFASAGDLHLDRVREASDEHGQAEANGGGMPIGVEEANGGVCSFWQVSQPSRRKP